MLARSTFATRSRTRLVNDRWFVAASIAVLATAPARAGENGSSGEPASGHELFVSRILHGPFSGGAFGRAVAPAFDVNADGYADVLVGDPAAGGATGAEPGEGVARCFFGSDSGISLTAHWSQEGNVANASFGEVLTGAGDVNGDGFGDALVAAPAWSGTLPFEGQVRLYSGKKTGFWPNPAWTFSGGMANARVGSFLAPLGDVNGDGLADFGLADSEFSLVRAFYGAWTSPPTTPSWTFPSNGAGQGGMIGLGDVNDDGYDDVLIAGTDTATGSTAAWLFRGSANGLSLTPSATILGPIGDCTYRVAAGGDIQGDGLPDGLLGDNAGQTVRMLRGTAGGMKFFGPTVTNPSGGAAFPSALAGGSDFDHNGFDDALASNVSEARAWWFTGSNAGLEPTAAWTAASSKPNSAFGGSLALIGDVDADGDSEAAIGDEEGTSFLHPAPNDDGIVHVFDGVAVNSVVPTVFDPGHGLVGTLDGLGAAKLVAFEGVKGMKLKLAFDPSPIASNLRIELIDPLGNFEEKIGVKLGGKVVKKVLGLNRSGLYALRIESKSDGPTPFRVVTGRVLPKTAQSRKEKFTFKTSGSTKDVTVSALPGATMQAWIVAHTEYSGFESMQLSLAKPGGGELGFEMDDEFGFYDISIVTLNSAGRYTLEFGSWADWKVYVSAKLKIVQPPVGVGDIALP